MPPRFDSISEAPASRAAIHPLAEVFVQPDSLVFIRLKGSLVKLRGPRIPRLIASLDGTRLGAPPTPGDQMRGQADLLAVLGDRGLLLDHDDTLLVSARTESSGPLLRDVHANICSGPLAETGLRVAGRPWHLADRPVPNSGPQILIAVDAQRLIISPRLGGIEDMCVDCFRSRLLSHDDIGVALHEAGFIVKLYSAAKRVAASLAHAALPQLTGPAVRDALLSSHVVTISVGSRELNSHALSPYATCSCWPTWARKHSTRLDTPVATVPHSSSGDLMRRFPQQALRAIGEFGIVQRAEIVADQRIAEGVHVTAARYADPHSPHFRSITLESTNADLTARPGASRQAFGSGWSENDARARASLEAFERYSCVDVAPEVVVRVRQNDLQVGSTDVPVGASS